MVVALASALAGAACASGGGDPEDFAKFADEIAGAAEGGDIAFFADRVEGKPYVCTEEDVEASTGPEAPPEPICLEAGYEFEAVPISNYGTRGTITTPEVLARDVQRFFEDALGDMDDRYGPGAVRLYATAIPSRPGAPEVGVRSAILTALQDYQGQPARYVRALDFEYVDGRWVITGETIAGFPVAVDLLEPSSAGLLYAEWTKY